MKWYLDLAANTRTVNGFTYTAWISFLDLRLDYNPRTCKITIQLYVKPLVLKISVDVDHSDSDTDMSQMSRVFASESLRFYHACQHYSAFIAHCNRYILSFLDRKRIPALAAPYLLFARRS